jgi:hypothetical protein
MCSVHFARGDPIRSHGCSMNFDTFARGGPSRFHRISIFVDTCTMGTPFGSHRIPLDLHPLSKLGFLRISTYFICFARVTPQNSLDSNGFASILQGVPLRIKLDSTCCPYILQGHPFGSHRISMYFNTFARGTP